MRHLLPEETRKQRNAKIYRLKEYGLTYDQIASRYGLNKAHVAKIVSKVRKGNET